MCRQHHLLGTGGTERPETPELHLESRPSLYLPARSEPSERMSLQDIPESTLFLGLRMKEYSLLERSNLGPHDPETMSTDDKTKPSDPKTSEPRQVDPRCEQKCSTNHFRMSFSDQQYKQPCVPPSCLQKAQEQCQAQTEEVCIPQHQDPCQEKGLGQAQELVGIGLLIHIQLWNKPADARAQVLIMVPAAP
ncbi:Proline-rich protein 9 [Fukomys damarensis]|uniref:Proline-rich protein 9 n=1 Tax=Fukomys damarensis TaxID=885580 RepID=A0A091D3Q5_FUKDA|nr:Proline-rich protein 9 [Fukomys damarensis]